MPISRFDQNNRAIFLFNILGIIDDTQKLKGTDLQYRVVGGIDYCDNKNLNIINNVFNSSHDRFEVYKIIET